MSDTKELPYKPGIIIQARLTSNRFPNKVLYPILGKPVIEWVIEACHKTGYPVVIAIPDSKADRGLLSYLKELGNRRTEIRIRTFQGAKEDVLYRYLMANQVVNFNPIIRVCADSPFVAPEDIQLALKIYNERKYLTMLNHVHVFGPDELEYAHKHDPFIASREHVVRSMHHTVDFPEDADRLEMEWNDGSPTMDGRKRLWGIK